MGMYKGECRESSKFVRIRDSGMEERSDTTTIENQIDKSVEYEMGAQGVTEVCNPEQRFKGQGLWSRFYGLGF